MAENEQITGAGNNQAASASTQERQFVVQRIYVKDVSFESPNAPDIFRGDWTPTQDLNLSTQVTKLQEDIYEVVLSLTVTLKAGDKTAFIVEVQQAGIFTVAGFSAQEMGPMMGAYCPNLLFPYAREVVSDLVVKGSFPALVLQHVNFESLYAQHQQAAAQEQAQAEAAAAGTH